MSHCLHFRPDIFAENQLYIRSLSLPDFKERNLRGNTPVTLTNTGCEHVIAHIELGAIFEPGVPTCPTSHVHIALVVAQQPESTVLELGEGKVRIIFRVFHRRRRLVVEHQLPDRRRGDFRPVEINVQHLPFRQFFILNLIGHLVYPCRNAKAPSDGNEKHIARLAICYARFPHSQRRNDEI